MRILTIITKLELGGAQETCLATCRELSRSGHEMILASGPGGVLDAEAAAADFEFVPIPALVRPISPFRDLAALLALTRLVRSRKPDLVHTRSSKAGILGRVAAWLGGAPATVHTVHGWGFSDAHPPLQRALFKILERAVRGITDHVITVSRADADKGFELSLIRPEQHSVIRSGIEVEKFTTSESSRSEKRQEWDVGDDEVLIVDISCFKPQKAPLDFVKAAGKASREQPNLKFALVGDGVLRPEIEAAIRAEGLEGRFLLPGWRRDIPEIIQAADVLALTSLWEGLPKTVLQARAAGRPTVATSVNGTPEALTDGKEGFLLEPGDVEGFARSFVRLARDPSLRERMGQAGRQGLEEFDLAHNIAQQEHLYRTLHAQSGSSAAPGA